MSGKRLDMNVLAPDAGLVTRFPSNQAGRQGRALVAASNVRMIAGRLYNSPGYASVAGLPSGLSPLNFIQTMQLQSGNTLVVGDGTDLYSAGPDVISANAGPSLTVFNDRYTMAGSVNGPGDTILTVLWTQNYGPSTVDFTDASDPDTYLTLTVPGVYGFTLSVTDGTTTATSECIITFIFQLVVSAGPDQDLAPGALTCTLPGSVTGTQAGLSSISWTQVSGPGSTTFSSASAPITGATVTVPGTYVYQLTADDGVISASDQATILFIPLPTAQFNYGFTLDPAIVFLVALDGGGFNAVTFDGMGNSPVYTFTSQIQYKLFIPAGTYTCGVTGDNTMGGTIAVSSGTLTTKTGSKLSIVSGSFSEPGFAGFSLLNDLFYESGNTNLDIEYGTNPTGPTNLTADIDGLTENLFDVNLELQVGSGDLALITLDADATFLGILNI